MEQGEDRNRGHNGDQADRHSGRQGHEPSTQQSDIRPRGRDTGSTDGAQGRRAPHGRSRQSRRTGKGTGRRRSAWKGYSPEQLAARAAAVPVIVYPEE